MNKTTKTMLTTAATSLAFLTTVISTNANALKAGQEKCYGVVKAGKNDCATKKIFLCRFSKKRWAT